MRTVRISLKAAKALLDGVRLFTPESLELQKAIGRCERATAVKAKLRKPKDEKREAKRKETRSIREAVMARAGGRCEACLATSQHDLQLDHFFGRAKVPQAASNCWALCWYCHRAKTDNHQGAASWLLRFVEHAKRHGYAEESNRARARLAFLEVKGGAL